MVKIKSNVPCPNCGRTLPPKKIPDDGVVCEDCKGNLDETSGNRKILPTVAAAFAMWLIMLGVGAIAAPVSSDPVNTFRIWSVVSLAWVSFFAAVDIFG